jgi:hypothetical protein
MARFVKYVPCPKCRDKGRDNRGDNCAVYSDGSSHCFSCGFHQFPKHYTPPTKKEIRSGSESMLPTDFSREVPARAWQWLLQWGLPYSYWQDKVGWSEKDQRLVFTEPGFSIGRWIPDELALAAGIERGRTPRKWFVWGNCHQSPIVRGSYSEAKEIALVEDCVSAHKVSQVAPCISLYGTSFFSGLFPCLRHIKLPVVLWLDKDQEGTMARKAASLSMLTGLGVRYVVTNDDPKALTLEQIRSTLSG